MGVFFALLMLFWYFFEFEVKSAFRWIRWSEMWAISLFVSDDYTVDWKGTPINFHDALDQIASIPARKLDTGLMTLIAALPMVPLKIPFIVIMGLMSLWAVMSGPGTQYRRKLNLDGLIGAQARTFRIISPFIKFNPSHQPPRPPGAPVPATLPPFAEALGPEEWLAYNEIPAPDGHIDEQAAHAAFAKQLGPRWQGPLKMAPHKQILLAAFCLKTSRKRREADELLGRLAQCWSHPGGINFNKDRKILRDAQKILRTKTLAGEVLSRCNQHGFETTVMLRALATAREEGGVMAPAQFLWLRAFDRTLWYPLNNLGRQSYHMEALGAMSHYKAERLTRRPIPKAKVQESVKSISKYMKSPRARPIPQLDYKGSGKRGVKKPK